MIKVLWYGDFLRSTGFGNVSEAIISRLMKTGKYEFTVLGVNYFGDPYNMPSSPYHQFKDIPVYPAQEGSDPFGKGQLIRLLMKGDFDMLFVLQDTFNMTSLNDSLKNLLGLKKIPYVFYFPVDSDLRKEWVEKGVLTASHPVAYTQYGAEQVRDHAPDAKVEIIPHGVDTGLFYPLDSEERKAFRQKEIGVSGDDFVVTNVNRYQPRKDLPRTVVAWTKIKKRIPNSKLCLHMNLSNQVDNSKELAGFIRRYVSEEMQKDIMWQSSAGDGVPIEDMRKIYGASDVIISTTTGEGWGMSTTEAMACKVPVVVPDHTSLREIVGGERGYLTKCNDFSVLTRGIDNVTMRPVVDVDSLAAQVGLVYEDRDKTREAKVEAAYQWVQERCNWDEIAARWDELFQRAVKEKRGSES